IGVTSRLLAEIGVDGDVATDNLLEGGTDIANNAARADDDTADDAKITYDPHPRQLQRCRHQGMIKRHHLPYLRLLTMLRILSRLLIPLLLHVGSPYVFGSVPCQARSTLSTAR